MALDGIPDRSGNERIIVIKLTHRDRRLGLLLRRLRQDAGLSLGQLAPRVHITKSGLANRETDSRAITAGALIETLDALDFDVYAVRRRSTGTGWPAGDLTPDRRTTP